MAVKECSTCGKEFQTRRGGERYCSDECRKEGLRRAWRRAEEKRRRKKPRKYLTSKERTVLNTCPKDCKYIGSRTMTCDYCIIKHRLRGGDVTTCTVYERRET
jgi:hypothetical protein